MLLVSTPIPSQEPNQKISGSLILGKIMNAEFIGLIESLLLTDLKLWPLGSADLSPKHQELLSHVIEQNKGIFIEQYDEYFQGAIALTDLSGTPSFLLTVSTHYGIKTIFNRYLALLAGILLLLESGLLVVILLLIYRGFSHPLRNLTQQLNTIDIDRTLITPDLQSDSDIAALEYALQSFIARALLQRNHETTLAIRAGSQETRQQMLQTFDDTTRLLNEGMNLLEKKLASLPTRDIEWIIMQLQINPDLFLQRHFSLETAEKLITINTLLRQYQKGTRGVLEELRSKALRNAIQLRTLSRNTPVTIKKSLNKQLEVPFVKK
jgi:hypothetical protein